MIQAMIFAAGMGTRLKPITDRRPKALVEVGGRALLDLTLHRVAAAGAQHIVVNIHHFAPMIRQYLGNANNFGMDIAISDESERLLNTGGGLRHAAPLFLPDRPILIHNVDILSNVNLNAFVSCGADADALLMVSNRNTTRYLLFDDNMRLVGWTNISTGEVRSPYPDLDAEHCRRLAFSGIHLFSPRLLQVMDVMETDDFSIIDFYLRICHERDIRGYDAEGLQLLDVGKQDTLAQAEAFIRQMPDVYGKCPIY